MERLSPSRPVTCCGCIRYCANAENPALRAEYDAALAFSNVRFSGNRAKTKIPD
ncbi:hypothetical protein G5B31_16625 [Rhodobacter sp. SGA-6-6]|uniref:hypothetical protein n=1 Tax=Rhodobacter sp. SGA-6-6 TaxID=2710882 RepID=UPI0013EA5EBF|nr:hypothetical protein [Rhodobacter sp. SGA-6-6]NGM47163.1 hypothetical protein [Rhodobacter sp. SGA-6-6]